MSEEPTYLSLILDEGKFAIGQALVQRRQLRPYCFIAGDAFNFTPTEDGTTVQGNLVYTGDRSLIVGSILNKNTFKFNLTFPESSGDFNIGNIILYLQSDAGDIFPFIWAVMKIPYPKQAQTPGSIGNRYVFEFIEKLINVNDVLALTIQPSEYFSLAGYTTELDLPAPGQALFQQFIVHEPLYSPSPFFGVRRAIDNTYWGMPLPFRVDSPFFGVLDGGMAARPFKGATPKRYFWGGRFRTPVANFRARYGGGTFTKKPSFSIGGGKFGPNPGYHYP